MTKKKFYLGIIIIAILHIGLSLFFGMQKAGFHEDEYYTYWSVSCEDVSPANFTWHTGHELQQRFLVKEGERFSYDMVVKNQAADVHPPLYYMALHTLMSLFAGSFYKWFGILLNLCFTLVTYVGIVALFYHLSDEKKEENGNHYAHGLQINKTREWKALMAGLVYAIAPSTISSVMLTRMYAMSTMWTVLYALIFVLMIKYMDGSKRRFAILTVCGAFVCYATFLTHYFSLLVPFFLTLALCIYVCIRRKGFVRMLIYGSSMLAAIGLGILTYPASLKHIFAEYRGEGAMEGLLSASWEVTSMFLRYNNNRVFAGLMLPGLIVFAIALVWVLVKGEKREKFVLSSMTMTCVLAFLFLAQVALRVGEDACRYFYPVMGLLIPLMVYTIWTAVWLVPMGESWWKKVVSYVVLSATIFPFVLGLCQDKVAFLYKDDADKVAFSVAHKEHPLIMVYSQDKRYRSWYVDNQLWPYDDILYMEYQYKDLLDDKTLEEAEKIVVYMDAPVDLLDVLIENNPKLSKYTLVRHDPFFYVYLVE